VISTAIRSKVMAVALSVPLPSVAPALVTRQPSDGPPPPSENLGWADTRVQRSRRTSDPHLALRSASENGHLEVVRLLLDRGAEIHAGEDYSLRWASHNGRLEVVRLLLDRGAEIHARNDEALRFAKSYGHLEVVELLRGRISQETPEASDSSE